GGLSKIRSFHARNKSAEVFIRIDLSESNREFAEGDEDKPPKWTYKIGIKTERPRSGAVVVSHEAVYKDGKKLLQRPDKQDEEDPERFRQTHLEQIGSNRTFRDIADFLSGISYMHLVPQLLDRMKEIDEKTRDIYLRKISSVVGAASPGLDDVRFDQDPFGRYQITASRSIGGSKSVRLEQKQLSDGTLKLIGLVWSLLEKSAALLLEEPEDALHFGIVGKFTWLLYKAQEGQKNRYQTFVSTHSRELLSDEQIDPREVLMLEPSPNSVQGANIYVANEFDFVKTLLEVGESIGDIVVPTTKSKDHLKLAFDV
ncbi:MAG: ATP-binding protein, partial [Gammaproteobacteria bacterium AqS3]|nr:ATP-binding protein [Gammaproteobacteria bacterium AqS3]